MKKQLFAIILSLCLCCGMLSISMITANAAGNSIPKNVKVKLLGIESDKYQQKWLVSDVSWDDDIEVNKYELFNWLQSPATSQIVDIPDRNLFSISKAPNCIDDLIVATQESRCNITLKTPLLNTDEEKLAICSLNGSTYCCAISQGDTFVVDLRSVSRTANGEWKKSSLSNPVEVIYTDENVQQQKEFSEKDS